MKKLTALITVVVVALSVTLATAQPPQGRGEQPSTEQRVEQLQKTLDLSEEQCTQLTKMYSEQEMPQRGDRDAMQKMMEAEKTQMKEILTEEQYTAWEKMMSERRPQGRPERQ